MSLREDGTKTQDQSFTWACPGRETLNKQTDQKQMEKAVFHRSQGIITAPAVFILCTCFCCYRFGGLQ